MELTEKWYYYRAPDDIRIDILLEDLRMFCHIELESGNDDEGLWLTYDEDRIFLSDTICCFNNRSEGRITDILRRHDVYLIPFEFNHINVYPLLSSITNGQEVLKIEYSTKETKYLNQFQISVKVSSIPDLTILPDFLFDRFGIHKHFPLRSVQVLPSRLIIRPWYVEQRISGNDHALILSYLRTHVPNNVG